MTINNYGSTINLNCDNELHENCKGLNYLCDGNNAKCNLKCSAGFDGCDDQIISCTGGSKCNVINTKNGSNDFPSNSILSCERGSICTCQAYQCITQQPTQGPSIHPTKYPSINPSQFPTIDPTITTNNPSLNPTVIITYDPSRDPSLHPSTAPTFNPSTNPSIDPSSHPSTVRTFNPSTHSSRDASSYPSTAPAFNLSTHPSINPSKYPKISQTKTPTHNTTKLPSSYPTYSPSLIHTIEPTKNPTNGTSKDNSNNGSSNFAAENGGVNIIIIVIAIVIATIVIALAFRYYQHKNEPTKINTSNHVTTLTQSKSSNIATDSEFELQSPKSSQRIDVDLEDSDNQIFTDVMYTPKDKNDEGSEDDNELYDDKHIQHKETIGKIETDLISAVLFDDEPSLLKDETTPQTPLPTTAGELTKGTTTSKNDDFQEEGETGETITLPDNITQWTEAHTLEWLRIDVGLEEYTLIFENNQINGEVLNLWLNKTDIKLDNELKIMGIEKYVHRIRIRDAIEKLKQTKIM